MGDYNKIQKSILHNSLKTYNISFTSRQLNKTLADKLTKYYNDNFETSELSICDNCEFYSNDTLISCPYCGEMFVPFDVGSILFNNETNEQHEIKSVDGKEFTIRNTVTNEEFMTDEKNLLNNFSLEKIEYKNKSEETVVEEEPTIEENVEEPVKETSMVVYDKKEITNYSEAKELLPSLDVLENLSYEELDAFIGSRGKLVADSVYDLGILLKVMKESKKYKEHFKTFEEYVKVRHDIHRQCAYNYIKIAEVFSRDDVRKLGVGVSGRLARADEDIREAIIEGDSGKGPVEDRTTRSIDAEIKELREEKKKIEETENHVDTNDNSEYSNDETDVQTEKPKKVRGESLDRKKDKRITNNATIEECKNKKIIYRGIYVDDNKQQCVLDLGCNTGIYIILGNNTVDAVFTEIDNNGIPVDLDVLG